MTKTTPSPSNFDIFVTKLTDAGNSASFAWVRGAGGTGIQIPYAVAVNGASVFVAGAFQSSSIAFGGNVLTNSGAYDCFVTKLVDAGTTAGFVWAQKMGGQGDESVGSLAVQGNDVFMCGYSTSSTASFGAIPFTNSTANGRSDAFVAKLTDVVSFGSFAWVQAIGGPGDDYAYALALNGTALYIGGELNSYNTTLGAANPSVPVSFGLTQLTNNGMFITRLVDNGYSNSFIWARQSGGTYCRASTIAVQGANLYVGGEFYLGLSASFGSTTLNNTLPGGGGQPQYDGYVTKLTDSGTQASFNWAKQIAGTGTERVFGLNIIGNRIYVAGLTDGTVLFDMQSLPSQGGYRGYFATLTDPTLTATTAAHGSLPFTLAPNPARAATTVALPAQPGAATATLTLLDALGRTVRTTTLALPAAGLRHELSLGGLAPGLYALRVAAGAATATQRLVVE